jgi:hypothetical protein
MLHSPSRKIGYGGRQVNVLEMPFHRESGTVMTVALRVAGGEDSKQQLIRGWQFIPPGICGSYVASITTISSGHDDI